MADPVVAIGGKEGEHVLGWQAREQKRLTVHRRRQQAEIEKELERTNRRKKIAQTQVVKPQPSVGSFRDEQEVLQEYKERTEAEIDELRRQQDEYDKYKNSLVDQKLKERDETCKEHRQAHQKALEHAQANVKSEQRKFENWRKEWEDKQKTLTEAQSTALAERDAAFQESVNKAQSHREKTKQAWMKKKAEEAKEKENKKLQNEARQRKRLEELQHQRDNELKKLRNSKEKRQERLRESISQLDQEDFAKRERFLNTLVSKHQQLAQLAKERTNEHSEHVKEVNEWRGYMKESINYCKDKDQAFRSYHDAKFNRSLHIAEEMDKRKSYVKQCAREMHSNQSQVWNKVKGSFSDTRTKVSAGHASDVKLSDVKLPNAPTLKELKVPTLPTIPAVNELSKKAPVPKRVTEKLNNGVKVFQLPAEEWGTEPWVAASLTKPEFA
ncbi:hypothetical protein CYMTET_8232 [Cymbomonas tetramitiformis]|uniref:Uncharacterized protein n=1 Tax=Cymbomonas tetramitiformis TaxID=36881 RepID=A0AAE0GTV1_9CHLO|nr:hypothetical protein CYMTET_8232 [Cymbomonas tetramitiformis]